MLRGNYTVKMDDKGRIKMPAAYRRVFEDNYGSQFYVTSITGECARLYPMKEWAAVEEKLQAIGSMDLSVRKFLDRTNYFGQDAEMDNQGRILIHPLLRTSAELSGDVAIMGYMKYLEVWELEKFKAQMVNQPYTKEDADRLAQLGV